MKQNKLKRKMEKVIEPTKLGLYKQNWKKHVSLSSHIALVSLMLPHPFKYIRDAMFHGGFVMAYSLGCHFWRITTCLFLTLGCILFLPRVREQWNTRLSNVKGIVHIEHLGEQQRDKEPS